MKKFIPREFVPDLELEAEYKELLQHAQKTAPKRSRRAEGKRRVSLEGMMLASGAFVFMACLAIGSLTGFETMRGDDAELPKAAKLVDMAKTNVGTASRNLATKRAEMGETCTRNIDLALGDTALSMPDKIVKLQEDPTAACGKTYFDVLANMNAVTEGQHAIASAQEGVSVLQESYEQKVEEGHGGGTFAAGIVIGAVAGFYAGRFFIEMADGLPSYDPGPYPAHRRAGR